jgi:hypothetical protein
MKKFDENLSIEHRSWGMGFFCCCISVLQEIVNYFNKNKKNPKNINLSKTFHNFKDDPNDVVFNTFFKINEQKIDYKKHVDINWGYAFVAFNKILFEDCNPFIKKYFSPSGIVESQIKYFEQKYKINYENTAYVIYRGNDKYKETQISSYDEFIEKSSEIYEKNPEIKFLVQTDEIEFREKFISKYKNSFYFEEIPAINKNPNSVVHETIQVGKRQNFGIMILSSVICGSRCKYVITHTGNVGLWVVLYRGTIENVFQYLNGSWV